MLPLACGGTISDSLSRDAGEASAAKIAASIGKIIALSGRE
jgi:hypothetical protein